MYFAPANYFIDTGKLTLKFIGRGKRPGIAKTKLKKNKVGGLTLSDFKTYKATVIKTVWHWQKNKQIDK